MAAIAKVKETAKRFILDEMLGIGGLLAMKKRKGVRITGNGDVDLPEPGVGGFFSGGESGVGGDEEAEELAGLAGER